MFRRFYFLVLLVIVVFALLSSSLFINQVFSNPNSCNIFRVRRRRDTGVRGCQFAASQQDEMAQCDTHVDFLHISGLFARIAPVVMLVKMENISAPDNTPRLFVYRRRCKPNCF